MLRLTVAVLAVVLTGTASAAGWRSLQVDGSSEEAFSKSVAAFEEKLTPARRYVFTLALRDVWLQGAKSAEADQGEYTAADYFRQLDGLSYEEVVTLTDPTGETARRYRRAYNHYQVGDAGQYAAARRSAPPSAPPMRSQQQPRGDPAQHGITFMQERFQEWSQRP
ncbi:MAG TPA: hypothetical protein VFX89_01370 [Gammaproteobacteria bacterium]|nr:hypothetical protein [Gammaproteobacteria bacterium]